MTVSELHLSSPALPAGNDTASSEEKPLPPLREDLALYPRSNERSGAPAWALHDPVRNQFFYISWPAFEVLSRWKLGTAVLISEDIARTTTLDCSEEMVWHIAGFLLSNQLVEVESSSYTDHLVAIARARRVGWLKWLLHHYLFFRVPLVHPDRFLTRTIGYVRWLGSRWFAYLTVTALVIGLFLVARQWSTFTQTFVDYISFSGVAAFAVTLVLAKVIHEFSHAYVAKAMGCRVPTIGVAFLVTWPVLYTDVNDVWKLPEKRDRLAVGGAGIAAELTLAIWSTFAWSWLPEGPLRTACFLLATTTWISSLAINLSPFMRFDGYFLLMDKLEMPNLHQRAFAIALWQIREILFGLEEPCPEEVSRTRRIGLTLFAFAVWLYRLFIFLSIAFLIYHFVIKIVGIFLFVIEIWWFIIMPVFNEFRVWGGLISKIRQRRRYLASLAVLGLLIAIAAVPWNTRVLAPAIQKMDKAFDVFVPFPSKLIRIHVKDGQKVKTGDILVSFSNMVAEQRLQEAERRIEQLRYEIDAANFDGEYLKRSKSLNEAIKAAEAEKQLAQKSIDRLTLTSPFDGEVTDVTRSHQAGQAVNSKDRLMIVRSSGQRVLEAFVLENDLPRIQTGDAATFLPVGSAKRYKATVEKIAPLAIRTLPIPELASINGGDIDVRKERLSLIPERALYQVRLTGESLPPYSSRRAGKVTIYGTPESFLHRVYRSVLVVLLREAGT